MSLAGVVVVTYNSAEVIGPCLQSCHNLDTVVVDNASQDATLDVLRRVSRPNLRVLANGRNIGFAAAVNQGVRTLTNEFILLLNPDVEIQSPIGPLVEAALGPGGGLAAGCLVDRGGQRQAGFTMRRFPTPTVLVLEVLGLNRLFPSNPVNRSYRYADRDLSQPGDAEQPAGAFLGFRRDVWEQLNGFDERFHPLWFEDVDFCKRARESGYRIAYVPTVTAMHLGGHSVSAMPWESRELCWYGSLLEYASKHFRRWEYRAVCAAVVLGSAFRSAFRAFQQRSLKPVAVFAKVSRLAGSGLLSGRSEASTRTSGALELAACGGRVRQVQR